MWRRVCALVVVAGCWSDDPLIDGALTAPQLAKLREDMKLPVVDPCGGIPSSVNCDAAARLGQDLFFEPALSKNGQVACVTCHDPNAWFIDTRTPNNLSFGTAKWTGRNSMATVDLGLKLDLGGAFTWNGKYATPGDVLDLAIRKPMGEMDKTETTVANVLANSYYAAEYDAAFHDAPTLGGPFAAAKIAMTAYLRRVTSLYSAFDNYILGDDDALTAAQKRGFGVFVGRGTCIECHRGPALSDLDYHVTGVAQTGANVLTPDHGRADVTNDPADDGKFLTPPLHNVARTAPYMHDGELSSLEEVVEFYRHGGQSSEYSGVKDPRIQPLDLSDQDASDLVAFLGSLNGMNVPAELTVDLRPFKKLCGDLQVCDGACFNTQIDFLHCGSCDNECQTGMACEGGSCVPSTCTLPAEPCGSACVDLANDPANCGSCGHTCTTYCMGGVCGS
jgi:cytochrome c peroxidase